jgi:hypothetical protein
MLDDNVCKLVGTDYWTTDALQEVRICQQIAETKRIDAAAGRDG